jgi:Mor family transcriptional regulator
LEEALPRAVEEGFSTFNSRLVASTTESQAEASHRKSIEPLLKSEFGMTHFFRSGSFGNGTNIHNYSDIDYFACIPRDNLKEDSSKTLSEIAEVLRNRFTTTGIRVDSPAIVVPFGKDGTEATEIIPADLMSTSNGQRIFDIPNGSSGWMRSSPDAHNSYVREVDNELSGKVKPLIRFLKAWKYHKSVPISSFYLELLTTKYAAGESTIVYAIDVKNVLEQTWKSKLSEIADPTGTSSNAKPCNTALQQTNALSKLKTAYERAGNALDAEFADQTVKAFYWWDLLFDDEFPSYYY